MNIFVAAWYYPPVTSSEGIVTYKLLRKSEHNYDVVSSLSENWSYHTSFKKYDEKNIQTYTINTDSIEEWVEFCVEKFEELYPERKYECIMTRSTPPESILVGLRIKEKYPNVKWIASLADPLANNPYELFSYINNNPLITWKERELFRKELMTPGTERLKTIKRRSESGIKLLCKLKEWETETINKADLIICPTERQLEYLDGDSGWKPKYFALPHSFCSDFYPKGTKNIGDKIVFTYTGYSDETRSLKPFVEAVNLLKNSGCPSLDRMRFRFVGNTPREIADMVLNYDLQNIITIEPPTGYYDSLEIMKTSDWLLHVDAYFPGLKPGGSIFFAGKIADYLGAKKPILALTGKGSPACRIIEKAGGVVLSPKDITGIADALENICVDNIKPNLNSLYIDGYDSVNVAKRFDSRIEELCATRYNERVNWHKAEESNDNKVLTVCVPSYNVQRCLDRCLYTLIKCKYAPYMDIIVVDDGSKDCTLDIAKSYEKHYPGIVRAIHKENGGHGSTINKAMDIATGKYFRVVDSDDWIDSDELDRVLERVISGEIDTDMVSTDYHIVNMESGLSYPIIQDCTVEYDKELNFSDLDLDNVYFTMSGSMIKTSVLRQANMKLQENTFFVDVEFILFPVPYINTVMFIDAFIYKYSRGNSEQSVFIPNMIKRYDHHERVMKRVIEYRMSTPMTNEQKQYYDSVLKRVLYTHYGLCTFYNDNSLEGYKKLEPFDKFLIKTCPELGKWIGRKLPIVKAARRAQYDYNRIKYSPSNVLVIAKKQAKRTLKSNKIVAKKLMKNRYTYRIATSKLFSSGKGLAFRNKLYKLMIG